jgi:hypothetical protein
MPSRFDREQIVGYYRALGEFVDTFANVEQVLFLCLYNLVGIPIRLEQVAQPLREAVGYGERRLAWYLS